MVEGLPKIMQLGDLSKGVKMDTQSEFPTILLNRHNICNNKTTFGLILSSIARFNINQIKVKSKKQNKEKRMMRKLFQQCFTKKSTKGGNGYE